MNLRDQAARLRTDAGLVEESIRRACASIDAQDGRIQALLPEPRRLERLLDDARALVAAFPEPDARPPLFGVLVGVKDMFRAEGFETRAGTRLPPALFAGPEASSVSALRRAGALVIGKTVTTELAYFAPGPTRNPRNPDHTPGGSSSGSAAAVAAGYCPLALGTQTIGSISRPASYCGVVGFKPTFGRISTDGVVPFSESADHVGFFVPAVDDAELVARVLCRDWRSASPSGTPVLGVPEGPYLEQATAPCLASFRAQLDKLAAAGYRVVRVPLFEDAAALNALHRAMIAAEMAEAHRAWFDAHCELCGKKTRELIEAGRAVSASELSRARENRLALRARVEATMAREGIGLWVSPSTLDAAPAGIQATGSPLMNLPWTHIGVPTVSVPAGQSPEGLPFGLQIAARAGEDESLLAWASELVRRAALD